MSNAGSEVWLGSISGGVGPDEVSITTVNARHAYREGDVDARACFTD